MKFIDEYTISWLQYSYKPIALWKYKFQYSKVSLPSYPFVINAFGADPGR
jgi:hypothetical protein